MSRLIDTEQAWAKAQKIYSDPVLLHAIKSVLDSTEAIEAELVVHGHWDDECRCTACGWYGEDRYKRDVHGFARCPECGAIMDGGDD